MAKKKRGKNPSPQRTPSPEPKAKEGPLADEAVELRLDAISAAEEQGVDAVEPSPVPESSTKADVQQALADARAARETFIRLTEQLRTDADANRQWAEELTGRASDLDTGLAQLKSERDALDAEATNVRDQRDELVELKAEAERGFLSRREEILGPVKEQIAELTAAWHDQETRLLADWDAELDRRAKEARETLRERIEEVEAQKDDLADKEEQLRLRERELDRRGRVVEAAEHVLEEDREALERERKAIAARARDEQSSQLQSARAAIERLEIRVADYEREEAAVQQLRRDLGEDPETVLSELRAAQDRARSLEAELRTRPGPEVQDELDDARQRLAAAQAEREEALRGQRELERQLEYQRSKVADVERLERTTEAHEAALAAYESEIEELTSRFQQLTVDSDRQGAFPECARMDAQFAKKAGPDTRDVVDLKEFAEELRFRMADYKDAKKAGKRLNYRERDVRIFLAGLAMSRLHLLEGVSGTGKTTLPHAFADAVGGGVKKIEVQAGWRDKQDLLGYYNSFERVFRETPFLQYLYRACLPPFQDRLIIIVLDEMNLSHPEQYFADFLSALEDPKSHPLVSLADRSLPDVPQFMETDAGVQLPLAPNVWFVGTANQDETTFGFAPKTQDRAHIMELEPHAPATPKNPDLGAAEPVGFQSLMKAFRKAETKHKKKADDGVDFAQLLLGFFQDRFHVGWGERMDIQIRKFIPVNIAADGSLGEALDHIVATKVLRKIEGRHTVKKTDLEDLEATIHEYWPDSDNPPRMTSDVLARQTRALTF